MHGQINLASPSYPPGPHVGHLKLAPHEHSYHSFPLVSNYFPLTGL